MLTSSRYDWYLSEIYRIHTECCDIALKIHAFEPEALEWDVENTQFAFDKEKKICAIVMPATSNKNESYGLVAISDPEVDHGDFKGIDKLFNQLTGAEAEQVLNEYLQTKTD